jgi:hypothetical protein
MGKLNTMENLYDYKKNKVYTFFNENENFCYILWLAKSSFKYSLTIILVATTPNYGDHVIAVIYVTTCVFVASISLLNDFDLFNKLRTHYFFFYTLLVDIIPIFWYPTIFFLNANFLLSTKLIEWSHFYYNMHGFTVFFYFWFGSYFIGSLVFFHTKMVYWHKSLYKSVVLHIFFISATYYINFYFFNHNTIAVILEQYSRYFLIGVSSSSYLVGWIWYNMDKFLIYPNLWKIIYQLLIRLYFEFFWINTFFFILVYFDQAIVPHNKKLLLWGFIFSIIFSYWFKNRFLFLNKSFLKNFSSILLPPLGFIYFYTMTFSLWNTENFEMFYCWGWVLVLFITLIFVVVDYISIKKKFSYNWLFLLSNSWLILFLYNFTYNSIVFITLPFVNQKIILCEVHINTKQELFEFVSATEGGAIQMFPPYLLAIFIIAFSIFQSYYDNYLNNFYQNAIKIKNRKHFTYRVRSIKISTLVVLLYLFYKHKKELICFFTFGNNALFFTLALCIILFFFFYKNHEK